MCNTCNGIGVVHHIDGSVIQYQACEDCTEEEKEVRQRRFEEMCVRYGVSQKMCERSI